MADLPFPITGSSKQQMELMIRLFEEMFEERVGGGYVGDVFQIDSDDVLSLTLSTTGGLTKSGSELAILNNPTGGLSSTADGERVKLKAGGGLSTDADGLYIADAYHSFGQVDCPAGTDPDALLPADTLTLANGTGISITGNSTTNTVTIAIADNYVLAAGDTLTGQMALSGDGITYFKERPRIELSRVLSVGKPSIVFRGTIRGFSLPVYSSDNEELFLDLPNVPARWDGASDPVVYITGYLDTANTSKKFKLACDWTYFSADDEPDGTAVEQPYVEITTGTWGQYHTFTAAITLNYDVVAANALAPGDFLQLRVYRIAASGDEIAGEVVVTGVAIKWRMDKLYSSS